MASVADMARGIIAGAAIAFPVAFLHMVALFGINFAVMQISPKHCRRIGAVFGTKISEFIDAPDHGVARSVLSLFVRPPALNVTLCIVSALAGRHRAVSP